MDKGSLMRVPGVISETVIFSYLFASHPPHPLILSPSHLPLNIAYAPSS